MIEEQLAGDGILTLTWRMPGAVNVKNAASIAAFSAAVERAVLDVRVRGVIVTSGLRDFVVGADIELLRGADAKALARVLDQVRHTLRRIETGGKMFVAALNGSALGGGLEIALACHRRIAASNPAARFGFPEITLGLIPGAGGTQRLPRLIGLQKSWPLLASGKPVDAERALELGLIDAVVPRDELLAAARDALNAGFAPEQPWDRKDVVPPGFQPQTPAGRQFFAATFASLRSRAWRRDDAALELLAVLYHGLQRPIEAGLAIELEAFARLAASVTAQNLIRIRLVDIARANRTPVRSRGEPPFAPRRIAIFGAGFMGIGIARAAATAGMEVVLFDARLADASSGKARISAECASQVTKGRITDDAASALLARIHPTENRGELRHCELIIEAVAEDLALKRRVIHDALEAAGEHALLASNTSTLRIGALAEDLPNPERIFGMHFFSPVDRMPLLEIIRAPRTSDASIAAGIDFARMLKKTPIVVADGPGFFTSRVFTRYLREAVSMVAEGVSPVLIENAARLSGMPVGPLAVADETALDLLHHIVRALRAQPGGLPLTEGERADEVIDWLVETEQRFGRKNSAGFYDYPAGRPKRLWGGLTKRFPATRSQPSVTAVQRRLLLVQVAEAARCIDEGIVVMGTDADVASVLGWGFPAELGGVAGYVEQMTRPACAHECAQLAALHGPRFVFPQ